MLLFAEQEAKIGLSLAWFFNGFT